MKIINSTGDPTYFEDDASWWRSWFLFDMLYVFSLVTRDRRITKNPAKFSWFSFKLGEYQYGSVFNLHFQTKNWTVFASLSKTYWDQYPPAERHARWDWRKGKTYWCEEDWQREKGTT